MAIVVVASLSACDAASSRSNIASSRTDSSGVQIVRLPPTGKTLSWKFDELYASGGAVDSSLATIPAIERAEVRGTWPVLPVIADIAVGPEDLIWIRRQIPGTASDRIDVIRLDGEYLGTLAGGSPFPAAFAGSGRIVEVSTDSLGIPVLRMYHISESD